MAEEVKKKEEPKKVGPFGKLKELAEDKEEQMEIFSTFVRLGILIWSGGILTLNYVAIPNFPQKNIDPTFIASVFTGVLASFGIQTAKNKDKGAAAGEPDKEQQVRDTKKELLDIISDDDFDPEEDLFDDNQHKVLDKLRKLGDDDTANEFESIGAAFNEMDDDAEERLDDFIDRLKGKTPPTETAIKNFNKVNDVYSDQTYSNDNINDYVKDSVNYLKSLSKVLDAGPEYGGLRQDQIEVVQDAMGTFKDVLDNMVDNVGYDENDPDSHTIDEIEADIEYIEDPLSDHDDYTKVGKVTGTLEDMMANIKKLGETEPAPKKESLGEESEEDWVDINGKSSAEED